MKLKYLLKNKEMVVMDKNKLRALKAQKTKLLNKECQTMQEFEEVQEKLNIIEAKMKEIEG